MSPLYSFLFTFCYLSIRGTITVPTLNERSTICAPTRRCHFVVALIAKVAVFICNKGLLNFEMDFYFVLTITVPPNTSQ